jgi:hypothetical protein
MQKDRMEGNKKKTEEEAKKILRIKYTEGLKMRK